MVLILSNQKAKTPTEFPNMFFTEMLFPLFKKTPQCKVDITITLVLYLLSFTKKKNIEQNDMNINFPYLKINTYNISI